MEQLKEDRPMGRNSGGGRGGVSPLYVLAAVIIWGLIVYAMSPLNRPEPTRLASQTLKLCAQIP